MIDETCTVTATPQVVLAGGSGGVAQVSDQFGAFVLAHNPRLAFGLGMARAGKGRKAMKRFRSEPHSLACEAACD